MNQYHILVIDDDTRLRNLLGRFLEENSFKVSLAKDSEEAKKLIEEAKIDLIIVDVMLPGESGIEFTNNLRKSSTVPIIILTARGEPDERIKGLESGADDYMPKPFEPKELLLRINNILKRLEKPTTSNIKSFGDFTFNLSELRLKRNGVFIHLTDGEAKILKILCEEQGNSVSREFLSEMSGGIDGRSIDVIITRLRRKLESNPRQPQFLQTVRNIGYVLHS